MAIGRTRACIQPREDATLSNRSPLSRSGRGGTLGHPMSGYTPNNIPRRVRIWNIVLAASMLAVGTIGMLNDDMYFPLKWRPGVHLHGEPACLMYAAILCAAANLISEVLDHYDVRDNERSYRVFAIGSQIAGWCFFGLALILERYVFHKATR